MLIPALLSFLTTTVSAQTPTIHCEDPGAQEATIKDESGFILHNTASGGGVAVRCGSFDKYAGDDSQLATITFKSRTHVYQVDVSTIKMLCGGSTLGEVFNPPAESSRSTGSCLKALKGEIISKNRGKEPELTADRLTMDGADFSRMTLRLLQSDKFTYSVDAKTFAEQCWYSNKKAEFYVNGSDKAEDKICMDVGMMCKVQGVPSRSPMYCKSLVKADEACNISAVDCLKQDQKTSPALNVRSDKNRPECKKFQTDIPLEELQRQIVACLQISRAAKTTGGSDVKEGK
ncbi:MAG: hypothetical protein JST80_10960 [Bdellovibrionales bacterium]|nr:hypothetical protein [Bdellovibrionales bacterium]